MTLDSRRTRFVLIFGIALAWCAASAVAADVRVMSFNIRYGTANDGDNHWDQRREFLIETIREFDPDLLGTQETLGFQKDYIAEQLPEYEAFGVGRDDGAEEGEMTAIFYRRDRFDVLDSGHFWLSETPEVPGSISWDSSLTRMVSWLKLHDREADSDAGAELYIFNTHFDHRGEQARLESARILRRMVDLTGGNTPVIVTGDFNAAEGSEPYETMFHDESFGVPIVDTYRVRHPEAGDEEGTGSGFDADNVSGDRIDWIGCTTDWEVIEAGINRTSREGRTPSDHWPVEAVLAVE